VVIESIHTAVALGTVLGLLETVGLAKIAEEQVVQAVTRRHV